MKKAIIAGIVVLLISVAALLIKTDPSLALTIMIAYWVFLDRLERED